MINKKQTMKGFATTRGDYVPGKNVGKCPSPIQVIITPYQKVAKESSKCIMHAPWKYTNNMKSHSFQLSRIPILQDDY